jgi:hypothetical protein
MTNKEEARLLYAVFASIALICVILACVLGPKAARAPTQRGRSVEEGAIRP